MLGGYSNNNDHSKAKELLSKHADALDSQHGIKVD